MWHHVGLVKYYDSHQACFWANNNLSPGAHDSCQTSAIAPNHLPCISPYKALSRDPIYSSLTGHATASYCLPPIGSSAICHTPGRWNNDGLTANNRYLPG